MTSNSVTQGETVLPAGGSQPKQLAASAVGGSVVVQALSTNSATVYIGGSDVTTSNGFPIAAGGVFTADISDASKFWLAGTQNDKVRWLVTGP